MSRYFLNKILDVHLKNNAVFCDLRLQIDFNSKLTEKST